jgi:hypothetical protein
MTACPFTGTLPRTSIARHGLRQHKRVSAAAVHQHQGHLLLLLAAGQRAHRRRCLMCDGGRAARVHQPRHLSVIGDLLGPHLRTAVCRQCPGRRAHLAIRAGVLFASGDRPPLPRGRAALLPGVAVLKVTPETKDEPGAQNDAAKKEERFKERPKNQSRR